MVNCVTETCALRFGSAAANDTVSPGTAADAAVAVVVPPALAVA
jgi:hypothetical protein